MSDFHHYGNGELYDRLYAEATADLTEEDFAGSAVKVHDRINDLCRQASRLAPRVADDALDACCTFTAPTGPRQHRAFTLVAVGFTLNGRTA